MKIAIFAITQGGRELAGRLAVRLPGAVVVGHDGIAAAIAASWPQFEGLVCIMAAGIAVRAQALWVAA